MKITDILLRYIFKDPSIKKAADEINKMSDSEFLEALEAEASSDVTLAFNELYSSDRSDNEIQTDYPFNSSVSQVEAVELEREDLTGSIGEIIAPNRFESVRLSTQGIRHLHVGLSENPILHEGIFLDPGIIVKEKPPLTFNKNYLNPGEMDDLYPLFGQVDYLGLSEGYSWPNVQVVAANVRPEETKIKPFESIEAPKDADNDNLFEVLSYQDDDDDYRDIA